MNFTAIIFVTLMILTLFFVVYKIFEKRTERTIRVTMDVEDISAFEQVLHTLRLSELLGMRYADDADTLFMIITVRGKSYQRCMTELKKISRIEVL